MQRFKHYRTFANTLINGGKAARIDWRNHLNHISVSWNLPHYLLYQITLPYTITRKDLTCFISYFFFLSPSGVYLVWNNMWWLMCKPAEKIINVISSIMCYQFSTTNKNVSNLILSRLLRFEIFLFYHFHLLYITTWNEPWLKCTIFYI